jgi:hypothetical protein
MVGRYRPTDGGSGPTQPRSDVIITRDDGVMVSFDPGLSPQATTGERSSYVVDSFLVRFGMRTEDLSFDLTLYLLLGAALAVVSAMKFERGFRRQDRAIGPVGS